MRFPYQGYPVRGTGATRQALVYRPATLIRIIGPVGDALAYGLLDTGADDTLLPAYFLGPLGVVVQPGSRTPIAGIGGESVEADFATVDLELRRRKVVYRWSTTVGFYDGPKAILGQSGVFEHFLASFNHRLRQATLRPNGVFPAPIMPLP
jgi:hypothetical protein